MASMIHCQSQVDHLWPIFLFCLSCLKFTCRLLARKSWLSLLLSTSSNKLWRTTLLVISKSPSTTKKPKF